MFSNFFLFLLIIFVGHCFCYANFPFPSLGIEHDKPPFCHAFTSARSCVNQQISGHPNRRWCIWSNTAGCFWNIPNIRNFYCRYLHGCRSPFCKWVHISPGMFDCVATDIVCLGQTNQQSCERERFTCRWYQISFKKEMIWYNTCRIYVLTPGETADNPNFPVCSNGLPPFGYANFPFPSLGFPFPSLGVLHANPPYCPEYSTARECTNQRFESVPSESWCIWSDADGCLWDVQNIKNFYCHFLTICQSPFCHPVYSPYECVATTDICLRQTNPQSCAQRRMICQWFSPGETPDNPNFPVCGTAID